MVSSAPVSGPPQKSLRFKSYPRLTLQKGNGGPEAAQNRTPSPLSPVPLPCSLPSTAPWSCHLDQKPRDWGHGLRCPKRWRQNLGLGVLAWAYVRPGRAPGMQRVVSTFLSSKEIPLRGEEVGGGESARYLSPSVCPGITQSQPRPLREGQICSDCLPSQPPLRLLPGPVMGVSGLS